MKRKFLEDLGLEKKDVDAIMEINGTDIENAKKDGAKFEKEVETLKSTVEALEGQIKERDNQLETLKKSGSDAETLKQQIEALQNENKAASEKHEAELKQLKIDTAIEAALTNAKAKNVKAVKALLDMDKVDVDKNGNVIGLEQLESLTKAEETKFLFETETKPAKLKGMVPGDSKDGVPGTITKEQFQRMGYKERTELFNTDKELYESLAN